MPQTLHPIDQELDEMDQTRRDMVRLFASDGHICEAERSLIDRITNHYDDIAGYRLREVAADSWKRNGTSDLTHRRFKDAGARLVDLDEERRKRPGANVIELRPRHSAG